MLIYKQIPSIIKDIEAVEKSTRPDSKITYAYRSIDEFMNVLNPLLAKHKVTIVPEVLENNRDTHKTSSGTTMHSVVMKIKYTFYAEDGSNVCAVMIGESFDSGDKASNKAQSIALKYAIMQVFMVPTQDIEDPDHHDTSKISFIKPENHSPSLSKNPVQNYLTNSELKQGKSVTPAQLKRLFAIQKQSNKSHEDVFNFMFDNFKKESSEQLTMAEYDLLIQFIENK